MLLSDLFGFQRVSGFSSASAECKADFNDEKGTGRNDLEGIQDGDRSGKVTIIFLFLFRGDRAQRTQAEAQGIAEDFQGVYSGDERHGEI